MTSEPAESCIETPTLTRIGSGRVEICWEIAGGPVEVQVFFGESPLPRASSTHDHYEAITRADTLAMELLDVWAARNKPEMDLATVYSDR